MGLNIEYSNALSLQTEKHCKAERLLVYYLSRFSPALADLTVPLRALCKKDTEEERLAARGHRPRVAFSSPRSQFFTIRTDLWPANNMFIFPCSKLVLQPISNGFVYVTLSLNWVASRLLTIRKKSSQRTSNSHTRQGKMY